LHHLNSAEIGTYAGTFKACSVMAGSWSGAWSWPQIGRPRRSLEAMGAGDHIRPRRTRIRGVHA